MSNDNTPEHHVAQMVLTSILDFATVMQHAPINIQQWEANLRERVENPKSWDDPEIVEGSKRTLSLLTAASNLITAAQKLHNPYGDN